MFHDVAAAAPVHDRKRRVHAVEEAEQVDVDHPLPLLDVGAHDRAEQHHAGVVDEDVEAAEPRVDLLDEPLGLLPVGDVGLERDRAAALALDPLDQRLEPVGPASADTDRSTGAREGQGRGLADARRGARDRCDLPLEALRCHRARCYWAGESGGLRWAQGRTAPSCAVSASSVASLPGRPTVWTPSGSPSAATPTGIDAAGLPVRFQTAV